MNATQRGCVSLLVGAVAAFFLCALIPFILLPGWQMAPTLPVISVPAEPYLKGYNWFGLELVNSLGGVVLAMVIVFVIAFVAYRHSKGWTKKVPGRFQALVEMMVGGLWSLTKQQAGNDKPYIKGLLFPIVASLFFFLLAGNWGKLIPGVETVGVLHCAFVEPFVSRGFAAQERSFLGAEFYTLEVPNNLNTGRLATIDDYHRCEAMLGVTKYIKEGYGPTQLDPYLDQSVTYVTQQGDTVNTVLARHNDQITAIRAGEVVQTSNYVQWNYEGGWAELGFGALDIAANNTSEDGALTLQFDGGAVEADHSTEEGDHSETTTEATAEAPAETVVAEATAEAAVVEAGHSTTEGEHSEEAGHSEEVASEPAASLDVVMSNMDTPLVAGQTVVLRPEVIGAEATTLQNQLWVVTPIVRGMTTDLSFTLGLAIMTFILIQVFGVWALGPNYFQKFINLDAIGNISKRPLGLIDFVVGLFEIISEFGKIISLSFRLFGALFAGTVLFAVIMFLVGTTIPAIILLLELIVGFAQAAVFAILTLIFCSQAMISHAHHDDEEHGDHAAAH
jgi:F0F1-type ATP synthase membrane subunit a